MTTATFDYEAGNHAIIEWTETRPTRPGVLFRCVGIVDKVPVFEGARLRIYLFPKGGGYDYEVRYLERETRPYLGTFFEPQYIAFPPPLPGIIADREEMQGREVWVYRLGAPNLSLPDGRPAYFVAPYLVERDPSLPAFLRRMFNLVRFPEHEQAQISAYVFAPEVTK